MARTRIYLASRARVLQNRYAQRSPPSTTHLGRLEREPGRRGVVVEHLDRLERELVEVLAEQVELASRSWVTVMMWQPIASAWKTFSTSRGLAQISSARGAARSISSGPRHQRHRVAAGVGDRPAKTETKLGAPVAERRRDLLDLARASRAR